MSTDEKLALGREAIPSSRPSVLAALDLPADLVLPSPAWTELHRETAHLRAPLEKIAREIPEMAIAGRRRSRESSSAGEPTTRWCCACIRRGICPDPGHPAAETERHPPGDRAAGDRVNLVVCKEKIGRFEVAKTDFTQPTYADGHKTAHLMPIIDHATKLVPGGRLASGR